MIYFDLLFIQIILVIVTDMTDFPDNVKKLLSWVFSLGKSTRINYRLHLLDCSLCQCWWACLIYLLITGNVSIGMIAYSLILALFCDITGVFMRMVKDYAIYVLEWLQKPLNK